MNSKSLALIPYTPVAFGKSSAKIFRVLSSFARSFELHFRRNKYSYASSFLLFSLGFFIGCFWTAFHAIPFGVTPPHAICFFLSTFVFTLSFSIIGIVLIPFAYLLHSFILGVMFFTLNLHTYGVALALLSHCTTAMFYAESLALSNKTRLGLRAVLRSKATYLHLFVFCTLEALTLLLS